MMLKLGFTIHPEKSLFIPTQTLEFLGFILNSINMTVRLATEKAQIIKKKCIALERDNKMHYQGCGKSNRFIGQPLSWGNIWAFILQTARK